MQTEPARFHSDGLALSGSFFWPPGDADGPAPLVIPCSGFTGLMGIHPARFARFLTARGHACFGFDYRGFARSEGPRGRVLLQEQVRDIVHAATFAAGHERVDPERLVLLGWGMGGGLVVEAARRLTGVAGLICVNGFYVGARVQRVHRGEDGYADFVRRAAAERLHRARTGEARASDPFDIYPLDPASRGYVDEVLRKTPDYDAQPYSWELADSLLAFDVEARAPGMRLPLLVAHGDRNALHPVDEARALHDAWGGPNQLFWLEGAGHTEFMLDDHPLFQQLGARVAGWLDELLARP